MGFFDWLRSLFVRKPKPSAAFFDFIRASSLFNGKLKQSQVDGINAILAAWKKHGDGDKRHLAYILATTYHETAKTMQPIREYGRGKGHAYGKIDQSGQAPYGRGFVQLTWRDNYIRADKELKLNGKLASNYDLALKPEIAALILVRGCLGGWFTGKKLSDYRDFQDMRRVVNGTDKAALIATYANIFQQALKGD